MTPPAGRLIETVPLASDRDVALARKAVGRAMDVLKARTIRKTRLVTAVSEIARNAIKHGHGGRLHIYKDDVRARLDILCEDHGPGIKDISQALTDGYTSGGGMGRGLGGAKRLVELFEIESEPGKGTCVLMRGPA